MRLHHLIAAACIGLALVAAVVAAYVLNFGLNISSSHDAWGQFGDYFGGTLNPLFALVAFLAALFSIGAQSRAARDAEHHLAAQSAAAMENVRILSEERVRSEMILVIQDIDRRLEELLRTTVTVPSDRQSLSIEHMVAEAQRVAIGGGDSPALRQFVEYGNSAGTIVEAAVREILRLVDRMRQFLETYSHTIRGSQAPTIVYYADKVYRLIDMLELFDVPEDTRRFFATVSDRHG